MRKTATIFILVFLFTTTTLFASTTVIKGSATQFKGKELELYTSADYISSKKEAIGFTTIKTNGAYNFSFDATEVKKVYLKIEDKTTSFFVEPGKVYNLNLTYSKELNKGSVYDKQLSLNFSFPVPTELNQQIGKFNTQFDEFIAENRSLFEKRDHSIEVKLKAFQLKMLKEFGGTNTSFVTDYINYSFASTQSALDVSYKKTDIKKGNNIKANLYLSYLDKKPVLYSNPEYISFFKTFFRGEFKSLSLKVEGFDISKAINDKASYTELSKALSKYPFLENEEFRILFMLNGLLEVSSGKYFTKANIIKILTTIKSVSKYPQHKIIATNIIDRITKVKFGIGSSAPSFELKNKDNESISLNSFKGKPVYINFWTNWSIPSQKEMKIMQMLYKKYKGKIEFISICADNDFNKMTSFLSKNEGYNWTFLHIGKDKKILSDYSVATYPTYILIDDNLKVVKFPAGRPGGTAERATEDNIEKDIYELINQ
ncbi:MAG: TlpA disulfide reductase family protein [Vicingaceae bacterium]|nr:TlpA disulfide reductase family protein [Vicingaceae bacterium]